MATEHKTCVAPFSKHFSEAFLVLKRIQQEIAINNHSNSHKPNYVISTRGEEWA
jgi:hypothetical protein